MEWRQRVPLGPSCFRIWRVIELDSRRELLCYVAYALWRGLLSIWYAILCFGLWNDLTDFYTQATASSRVFALVIVNRFKIPQGPSIHTVVTSAEGCAMIHRNENCLIYKFNTCLCHSFWQGEFTGNRKQVVNRLKIPQEGSAVIHRKKNDLVCKDAACLCHSLWHGEFTGNRKQVVNRLKIPQGLSTLLFHRWSEVPSRGGVRGDSP